jgi:hypothetical protein
MRTKANLMAICFTRNVGKYLAKTGVKISSIIGSGALVAPK